MRGAVGKSRKKPYQGSRAISRQCRCHGGCPRCFGDRMHQAEREAERAERSVEEWTEAEEA